MATQFRTAATTGVYADAVLAVLGRHRGLRRVVDVGAGDGQLAVQLARRRPDLDLVAVDLRPPDPDGAATGGGPSAVGVDGPVRWCLDWWDVAAERWSQGRLPELLADPKPTALIASEWLDEIPVVVLERAARSGWVTVLVDSDGAEHPGPEPQQADRDWAKRWWTSGARVEVGRSRDRAWAELIRQLHPAGGLALMVDYGHRRDARPADGSLQALRAGRRLPVVPDGTRNLSCDVAVDAVRAAGEAAGAVTVLDARQRDVLPELLVELPMDRAGRGGSDALSALARRSVVEALVGNAGFGSYHWLLQQVPPS